ncbi:MAG: hypothetical protein USCGTAYLOR_01633 [Chromatiales bacterium USCg_Taylor]|nr:MAG: hypothetical protein USCGTAYLOR_01633 [Chromatiales bacterium USCg_Taylor]
MQEAAPLAPVALSGAVDEVAQLFGEPNGAPAVGLLVNIILAILLCIPTAILAELSAQVA